LNIIDKEDTEDPIVDRKGSFWTGYNCLNHMTKPGPVDPKEWDGVDGREFFHEFWKKPNEPSRSLVHSCGSVVVESCVELTLGGLSSTTPIYNDADCFLEKEFLCEKKYRLSPRALADMRGKHLGRYEWNKDLD